MKPNILFLILCALLMLTTFSACASVDKPLTAAELLDLGEKYLLELNYEQALVQFLAVIEIESMNVRAYLGGTDAYLHLDRIPDAVEWLTAGIEITDSKNLAHVLVGVEKSVIEGFIALAEAYEAEGWFEKALELLQRVYDATGDEIIGRKLGIIQASEIVFRDNYVIQWQDSAFENLIRQYLGKESGDIYYDDVKLIARIEIWGQMIAKQDEQFMASHSAEWFRTRDGREGSKNGEIRTLADLEHFTSLSNLSVNYQENIDISALADTINIDCLRRLTSLTLTGNNITDISVVSELIALKALSLGYNEIVDISPISMLIELSLINIANNTQLSSAEPLRGLRKLSSASVSFVNAVDLNVFVGMPELRRMDLVGIESIDYSVLTQLNLDYLEITCDDSIFHIVKQLRTLTKLRIHGQGSWNNETNTQSDGLTNISGIEALANLTQLDLLAPNCQDISPLATLRLEQLELNLPDDIDLTPLKNMTSLAKVVVPQHYNLNGDDGNSLLERARAVLPNVEVTTDRW
jgi:tetratricopeptide (TPR) repeat protein